MDIGVSKVKDDVSMLRHRVPAPGGSADADRKEVALDLKVTCAVSVARSSSSSAAGRQAIGLGRTGRGWSQAECVVAPGMER